jgi:hypothetical protein
MRQLPDPLKVTVLLPSMEHRLEVEASIRIETAPAGEVADAVYVSPT